MSPPARGKRQVTALTARRAGLRKRKHLDTRSAYLDQCCFRSSRTGFVDHAGALTAEPRKRSPRSPSLADLDHSGSVRPLETRGIGPCAFLGEGLLSHHAEG